MIENRIKYILQDNKRIAIMGGTFDPIHFGHLIAAETVREKYNLDKVIFLPSGNPPHKDKRRVTSKEDRYNMVQMATASNQYFDVSRMEIDRDGYTYTIDTIREFVSVSSKGTNIYFITGADAVYDILTWKDADELLSVCRFIAVTRPGYNKKELEEEINTIKSNHKCNINILEIPDIAISSTDIRQRVMKGSFIKYLVPEHVEAYIRKHAIYQNRGGHNE